MCMYEYVYTCISEYTYMYALCLYLCIYICAHIHVLIHIVCINMKIYVLIHLQACECVDLHMYLSWSSSSYRATGTGHGVYSLTPSLCVLNEMSPSSLRHLNTWPAASGVVCTGLCHWEWAWRLQKPPAISSALSLLPVCQLRCERSAAAPAAFQLITSDPPLWALTAWRKSPKQTLFYHNNRKVTKTRI